MKHSGKSAENKNGDKNAHGENCAHEVPDMKQVLSGTRLEVVQVTSW